MTKKARINRSRLTTYAKEHKVLHKVRKRWMVVSLLSLALLGGGAVASGHQVHAASAPAQITNNLNQSQQRQRTQPNSVQNQANMLHNHILKQSLLTGQRTQPNTQNQQNNKTRVSDTADQTNTGVNHSGVNQPNLESTSVADTGSVDRASDGSSQNNGLSHFGAAQNNQDTKATTNDSVGANSNPNQTFGPVNKSVSQSATKTVPNIKKDIGNNQPNNSQSDKTGTNRQATQQTGATATQQVEAPETSTVGDSNPDVDITTEGDSVSYHGTITFNFKNGNDTIKTLNIPYNIPNTETGANVDLLDLGSYNGSNNTGKIVHGNGVSNANGSRDSNMGPNDVLSGNHNIQGFDTDNFTYEGDGVNGDSVANDYKFNVPGADGNQNVLKNLTFNFSANSVGDNISYVVNDSDQNYQGTGNQANGHTLGTTTISGANDSPVKVSDLTNVPANYHVINTPNFNYGSGAHDVAIAPNTKSVDIKYVDTDPNGIVTEDGRSSASDIVQVPYDTQINSVVKANVPDGYQATNGTSYDVNGNNNQSDTVNISGNPQNGVVTVKVNKYNGDNLVGTDYETAKVSGKVGTSYTVDPANYVPNGYNNQNSDYTGQFTPDGINNSSAVFNYSSQKGSAIPVKYVNQDGKVLNPDSSVNNSPDAITGVITGNVGDSGNASDVVHVPAGYELSGESHAYTITETPQNPIVIHVTGRDSADLPGNGRTTIYLQKESGGSPVGAPVAKTVQLNDKKVGDTFSIDPTDYTPNGYTSVSQKIYGSVTPTGLSTNGESQSAMTFYYVAKPAGTIQVNYYGPRHKNIKKGVINGSIGQSGNIYSVPGLAIPNGYTYSNASDDGDMMLGNGSNLDYMLTANNQTINISLKGNPHNLAPSDIVYPNHPNVPNDNGPSDVPNDPADPNEPIGPNNPVTPSPWKPVDSENTLYIGINLYKNNHFVSHYTKRYTLQRSTGTSVSMNARVFRPSGYSIIGPQSQTVVMGANGFEPDWMVFNYGASMHTPSNPIPNNPSNPSNRKHDNNPSDVPDSPNGPVNPNKPFGPSNPVNPQPLPGDNGNTFSVGINLYRNGQFVTSYEKRFTESGYTGDNFTIDPSEFTPNGYTSRDTNNVVNGVINSGSLSPDSTIYNYDANGYNPSVPNKYDVLVKFFGENNNQPNQQIGSTSKITGYMGNSGNVIGTNGIAVPNGYTVKDWKLGGVIQAGTNPSYTINSDEQEIDVDLNSQVNHPKNPIPFNPSNGNNHKHNTNGSDVPNDPTNPNKPITPNNNPSNPDNNPVNPVPTDPSDAKDTYYVGINKFSNNKFIGAYVKRYTVSDLPVGAQFTINPASFTPKGYSDDSADNTVTATVQANQVSPQTVVFRYNAYGPGHGGSDSPKPIKVDFYGNKDGRSNQLVEQGSISGYLDTTGNVIGTNGITMPKGYNISNWKNGDTTETGTTPTYRITNQNQTISVYLSSKTAKNDAGGGPYTPVKPSPNPSNIPSDPSAPVGPDAPNNPNTPGNRNNTKHGIATLYLVQQVNGKNTKVTVKTSDLSNDTTGQGYDISPSNYVPNGYKVDNVHDHDLTGCIQSDGSLSNGVATWYYDVDPSQIQPINVTFKNDHGNKIDMNGNLLPSGVSETLSPSKLATLGAVGDNVDLMNVLQTPRGYHFTPGQHYWYTLPHRSVAEPAVGLVLQVNSHNTFNNVTDKIVFNGDSSADTTITGIKNSLKVINAPKGYQFTGGSASKPVILDGFTHSFTVVKKSTPKPKPAPKPTPQPQPKPQPKPQPSDNRPSDTPNNPSDNPVAPSDNTPSDNIPQIPKIPPVNPIPNSGSNNNLPNSSSASNSSGAPSSAQPSQSSSASSSDSNSVALSSGSQSDSGYSDSSTSSNGVRSHTSRARHGRYSHRSSANRAKGLMNNSNARGIRNEQDVYADQGNNSVANSAAAELAGNAEPGTAGHTLYEASVKAAQKGMSNTESGMASTNGNAMTTQPNSAETPDVSAKSVNASANHLLNGKNRLPQTGDSSSHATSMMGVIMASIGTILAGFGHAVRRRHD